MKNLAGLSRGQHRDTPGYTCSRRARGTRHAQGEAGDRNSQRFYPESLSGRHGNLVPRISAGALIREFESAPRTVVIAQARDCRRRVGCMNKGNACVRRARYRKYAMAGGLKYRQRFPVPGAINRTWPNDSPVAQ